MGYANKVFLPAALPAGIICFLVYLRSVYCGFVGWDDSDFVLNNLVIRQFDANLFIWSFTTVPAFSGIWIPLTWISFAVDYHFWGLNPVGYHLTNIFLHSVNVIILVFIAGRLCRSFFAEERITARSAAMALLLTGLLFGLHPLHVESVAWVTERKDVLNGVFFFGSVLFYLHYAQRKQEGLRFSRGFYTLSLFCFLLSLMAKPVSVVLPLMLLVLDWTPLNRLDKTRFKTVLLEKVPYLALAALVMITTLYVAAGKDGLLISPTSFPLAERIAVSGNALFEYLRLILIPLGIVPYEPLPAQIPYSYIVNSLLALLILLTVFISRSRVLKATTLCFMLPLLPTLAFFQNNDHAYAARYMYLPFAIPCIVVAIAIATAGRKVADWQGKSVRWGVAVLTAATLGFYMVMDVKLIGLWDTTGTFWSRIIEVRPMGRAYQERGLYHFSQREFDLAIEDFTKAIDTAFGLGMYDRYNLNAFRGEAYRKTGQYEKAVVDFTYAISIAPRPVYYYHRGLAHKALGRVEAADEDFSRAGTDKGPLEWY